jgi:hypothetical protein
VNDNAQQKPDMAGGMHFQIGNINADGNVVIAGGDVTISGDARGDTSQTMNLGGVAATPESARQLKQALDHVDEVIQSEPIAPDVKAAAVVNAQTLRVEMTSPKKPNEHILVQAAESLYRFGPNIAGAVVAAFTTPLAGQIVASAGRRALEFYRGIVNGKPEASSGVDEDLPLPMGD